MGLVKPSEPGYFAAEHRRILERWTSAPRSGNRPSSAVTGSAWLYVFGVVALGLGLILTYAGFRAPPILAGGK